MGDSLCQLHPIAFRCGRFQHTSWRLVPLRFLVLMLQVVYVDALAMPRGRNRFQSELVLQVDGIGLGFLVVELALIT